MPALVVRRPGKLPVIFHVNGKEITLHLQLSDSVFKIKQLLAAKGYTVTSLMLGSARIDDNATVEKAKLIPFSSVYCKFSLFNRSISTDLPSFMPTRHVMHFFQEYFAGLRQRADTGEMELMCKILHRKISLRFVVGRWQLREPMHLASKLSPPNSKIHSSIAL